MPLDHKQIQKLIELIAATEEQELDCDEFTNFLASWGEKVMNGESVATANESVRHHLDHCAECRAEFQIVLDVLKDAAVTTDVQPEGASKQSG